MMLVVGVCVGGVYVQCGCSVHATWMHCSERLKTLQVRRRGEAVVGVMVLRVGSE